MEATARALPLAEESAEAASARGMRADAEFAYRGVSVSYKIYIFFFLNTPTAWSWFRQF